MRRSPLPYVVVAAVLLSIAGRVFAVPVLPGAAGFGMDTPAGRGGTVYKVTNLNTSGTGSLRACIDGATPRVCVFETSGTIKLTTDLIIRNDFITIAGQTAPSPGIMLRGAALKITASNVLVQHLRIRAGDDTTGPDYENRDSLKINGSATKTVRNIVIDHCSFSWAVDENVSVWGPHDNVTFSNNIFSEPLNDSFHPHNDGSPGTVPHGYGLILGPSTASSITMVNNLFAHSVERNPLSRAAELVYVNNIVYDRGHMDVDLQSDQFISTKSTIIRNAFIRGPSYSRETSPIFIHTDSGALGLGPTSRAYQSGNYSVNYPRALVTLTAGDTIPGLLDLTHYPVWNGGLTVRTTADDLMYNYVLDNVGARPKDRDVVDKRIVLDVRNRTGQIINCVAPNGTTRCAKNAGGWPAIAQNFRALSLPANPNTVTAGGYTNLELWLQSMEGAVTGVVQGKLPAAPLALYVN